MRGDGRSPHPFCVGLDKLDQRGAGPPGTPRPAGTQTATGRPPWTAIAPRSTRMVTRFEVDVCADPIDRVARHQHVGLGKVHRGAALDGGACHHPVRSQHPVGFSRPFAELVDGLAVHQPQFDDVVGRHQEHEPSVVHAAVPLVERVARGVVLIGGAHRLVHRMGDPALQAQPVLTTVQPADQRTSRPRTRPRRPPGSPPRRWS